MGFRLNSDEYFHGIVKDPKNAREIVVVSRGLRAVTVRLTEKEAKKRGWGWVIELRMDMNDKNNDFKLLGSWSSVEGLLPPNSRREIS